MFFFHLHVLSPFRNIRVTVIHSLFSVQSYYKKSNRIDLVYTNKKELLERRRRTDAFHDLEEKFLDKAAPRSGQNPDSIVWHDLHFIGTTLDINEPCHERTCV